MKISDLIVEMQQAVSRHKKGELGLGWRIRLWSAMKTKYGDEADFRRNVLALMVARDAFSVWENGKLIEAIPPERIDIYYAYPRNALNEYRRYLIGDSSLKKVAVLHDQMRNVLHHWRAKPQLPLQAAYISIAAVAERLRSFDDDIYEDQGWFDEVWNDDAHLKITDDSLVERDSCDAHFFASLVAVHLAKRKVNGRREFWQRWLSESVPAVLSPIAKVRARL